MNPEFAQWRETTQQKIAEKEALIRIARSPDFWVLQRRLEDTMAAATNDLLRQVDSMERVHAARARHELAHTWMDLFNVGVQERLLSTLRVDLENWDRAQQELMDNV